MLFEEYQNMANLDQSHWYFRGMNNFMLELLAKPLERLQQQVQNNQTIVLNDRHSEQILPEQQVPLKILDAGAGTGWFAQSLKPYGEVIALDINDYALSVCKERGFETVKADLNDPLPFPDKTFDFIACSEVLYHSYIPDDLKVMHEFYRVLKPGGLLLVKLPAHMYLWSAHDEANLCRHRYEKREVRELFTKSQFVISEITFAGFCIFPLVYLKRKLFSANKPTSDIQPTNAFLNFCLYALLAAEGALAAFGVPMPQGSSIICIGKKI